MCETLLLSGINVGHFWHGLDYVHGGIVADEHDDDHPDRWQDNTTLKEAVGQDQGTNPQQQVNWRKQRIILGIHTLQLIDFE